MNWLIEQWYEIWDNRTLGAARSPKWREVRTQHLALHPRCACCWAKGSFLKPNEIHHKRPFNLEPALELSASNLITLCRRCHLLIGHLGSFRSFNIDVEKDAEYFYQKIINRP